MTEPKYKRVIMKISGEALCSPNNKPLDFDIIDNVTEQIIDIAAQGVEIGIIVGGGNIWRGARVGKHMDRTTADYMGMLATVINALALQDSLEEKGLQTRVQTAIEMREVAEPYVRRKAISHLEHGKVVIFGAGTGNPFFSTDTTAALRAAEIDAEVILLAKNVDGVYSADPLKDVNAVRFHEIGYDDVLAKHLEVMDFTATSLAMERRIPVLLFALKDPQNIVRAIMGETIGTIVH